ncbi:MAG: ATP-binding cassette domain-containing protein, partial [Ruminococcus flavefaciens]|nr:ATP-binding cassette domain-containing protein [Ruminococcus flavefaciens]
ENVAFGIDEKDINDNKVWEVLKDAAIDDFVKKLPDGLYTQIGERGVRLSGGQCQRIGIARALYSEPEILFFDEATSALDNDTEKAIMDSIYELRRLKTIIIIAHRLTTIEGCDHIFRVEDGKVIQEK